jgi:hypothetical protein
MTGNLDRLWNLLPVVYRQRDLEVGRPLDALLQVIAEQVDLVEGSIDQLYENWFIETCQSWAVPYIADLIGYRPVHDVIPPADPATTEDRLRNSFLFPRREVANTIRYRRRKGTLSVLELLAIDVAGWPARVVEFDRLVAAAQSINHLRVGRPVTIDLRQVLRLTRLDSAFDTLTHTIDVRRPGSHRHTGRYNLSSVIVFVSRMKSFSINRGEANCIEESGRNCFTFNALGNDTPLYTWPNPDARRRHIARELDLPLPISRHALEQREIKNGTELRHVSEAYYGPDKSFAIWAPGWGDHGAEPIPSDRILVADLSQWRYRPSPGTVAVDPELGRIAFPPGNVPSAVSVTYQYGFAAEIGGGDYHRYRAAYPDASIYHVARRGGEAHGSLRAALASWHRHRPECAVIEFDGSEIYDEEKIEIRLGRDQQLVIRAAEGTRPLLRLLDWEAGREDAMRVNGDTGSRLALEGMLVSGRGLRVSGQLAELTIRHSTLVPGWDLFRDGRPRQPRGPSLALEETGVRIVVDHSIIGPMRIRQNVETREPVAVEIVDSIVDAGGEDAESFQVDRALAAYARVTLRRATVLGRLSVHEIVLAENCIFAGRVTAARRQRGCIRFCYIPPGSRTPSRYSCQPDLAIRGLTGEARQATELRLVPTFESTRYGTPHYARLLPNCAEEIRRGADDDAELGVYHDLFEPQREASLRTRLTEFVPINIDVGLAFLD